MTEDEDIYNCSYEEDNPSESSSVSLNASAFDCLDDTVLSADGDNLDESVLNASFESSVSDTVQSTPTKRTTRSQSQSEAERTPTKRTRTRSETPAATPEKPKKATKGKGTKGKGKKGKQDTNNNKGPDASPFKVPKVPPAYLAKCPRCGSGFMTFAKFSNHNLAHQWKDLAGKIPTEEEICEQSQEKAAAILESMTKEDWNEQFSGACASLMEKLDSSELKIFLNTVMCIVVKAVHGGDINKKPLTFAASSREFVITHINASLNDKEIRDDLLEKLLNVHLCPTQIAYPLITTFVRRLGNKVLAGIFFRMSERDPLSKLGSQRSKDDFDSLKSQRVVHYISGSCMRGIVRHSYSHPNSAKLRRRKLCVLRRFGTIGEPIGAQLSDKAYWTGVLNRKSLFFVKDDVLPFFVELAKLIQGLELPNGSLNHERVMQHVVASPHILQRWCDIVDSDLNDDESIDLLIKVVRALTNTFARGVLLMRMNQRSKKGTANKSTLSVSHRARLL